MQPEDEIEPRGEWSEPLNKLQTPKKLTRAQVQNDRSFSFFPSTVAHWRLTINHKLRDSSALNVDRLIHDLRRQIELELGMKHGQNHPEFLLLQTNLLLNRL